MFERSKTFLSDSHEEFGRVSWYVDDNPSWGDYLDAQLNIWDCDKGICLDFTCEKKKHVDKRIEKLDTLITELQKMKSSLEKAKTKQDKKFYY